MAKANISGAPAPAPNPVGPAGVIPGVNGAGSVTKKGITSTDVTLPDSVAFETSMAPPSATDDPTDH